MAREEPIHDILKSPKYKTKQQDFLNLSQQEI